MTAVHSMVAARFHPSANHTTITVAEDIADRMHRSKDGTVAYCLHAMVRRLGLSRSCISKHIAILRELGLLAWVEKGSARRNALRTRLGDRFGPGGGFKRSATIYAPVAPPVWDRAEGRRVKGHGYNARVVGVTDTGRERAIAAARRRAPKPSHAPGPWTPSVRVPKPRTREVSVSGGLKDTPHAARPKNTPRRTAKGLTGWSPQQAARAMADARTVQLHTWWTQGACVRQLAYALRPLLAAGWSADDCARELARWNVTARPRRAGAYVAAEIRRRANTGALLLPGGSVKPYRQAPADEHRYQAWMELRREAAERRWEETAHLRARVRSLVPKARAERRRVPRGLREAQPDRVLTPSSTLAALAARGCGFRSGEDLWAEAEEIAAARIEAEGRSDWWEYRAGQPAEPWQTRA
jgi:hypothetical protein